MKIEMKKPAECGGLRRGQLVCVETGTERGTRREYFSVRNWRVALALWALTEYLHRSGADCEVPHEC